ncbi:hypothetical protein ACVW1C_008473 [Bradyrhizobium sp. USDA 4011]|jgi:hypothetical protein
MVRRALMAIPEARIPQKRMLGAMAASMASRRRV